MLSSSYLRVTPAGRFLAEFLATDLPGEAVRPLLLPVLFGFCDYLYPVNRSRAVVLYGR